jgi:lipid II:glycine glycyltransferase (peptidoglycan interpeptide bridge formation enzyme)
MTPMVIQSVPISDRKRFDQLASHPLQSWAWGEFREKTGVKVVRLGRYKARALVETAQITFHPLPKMPWTVGYWPKGGVPSSQMVAKVKQIAKENRAILVKLEPNVLVEANSDPEPLQRKFSLYRGRPLFTRWSLWLDLKPSEEELLKNMHPKTRYNTRLAERRGVKVKANNSPAAFEAYWKLTEETTKRQGFYAHNRRYHQLLFETLAPSGLAQLFTASFEGQILTAWIVFNLNKIIYYPYGASTRENRGVFANNLIMWEVIKWGKKQGAELFDMWGSPGPDPKPSDDWYGFHRFKLGYGAKLVEFVGTYDLVCQPLLYPVYRIGNDWLRWWLLKLKAKIFR